MQKPEPPRRVGPAPEGTPVLVEDTSPKVEVPVHEEPVSAKPPSEVGSTGSANASENGTPENGANGTANGTPESDANDASRENDESGANDESASESAPEDETMVSMRPRRPRRSAPRPDPAPEPDPEPWEPPPDVDPQIFLSSARRTIASRYSSDIQGCFDEANRRHPGLSGRVAMAYMLLPDGRVASARVTRNSTGDAEVGRCLIARAGRWQLPPPPPRMLEVSMSYSR